MSYKTDLQANNAELQSNNTDLQAILDTVNTLPEGGGGVTAIIVTNSQANIVECYDMVKAAYVSIPPDGTTINVTDHLVVRNVVEIYSSLLPEIVLKNGENIIANVLNGGVYKGAINVVYFERYGGGPVAKEDIAHIDMGAFPD